MQISRSTFVLFAFYALLFSGLLFATQVVYSPVGSVAVVKKQEKIESPDLHIELTSEWAARRQEVIDRLESAPEKPSYSIALRTTRKNAMALKALLESTINSSYLLPKVTPIAVDLVDNRKEPRGQTTDDGVSMIATIPSDSEFLKVFVHELGHIVDLHFLVGGRFTSDPSDEFYKISWLSYDQKKKWTAVDDFVSGYALTNKYEDFGESFAFYVFHNDEFRKRAAKKPSLALKYNFLANNVFLESEFQSTSFEQQPVPAYLWDTTKVAIKTNKYLFYLR